jgi:hypothetical protein
MSGPVGPFTSTPNLIQGRSLGGADTYVTVIVLRQGTVPEAEHELVRVLACGDICPVLPGELLDELLTTPAR